MRREQSRAAWTRRRKLGIAVLLIGLGCLLCVAALRDRIGESLDTVGRVRAEGVVNQLIHQTVEEVFSDPAQEESLFQIERGPDGTVQTVQADTRQINRLISRFADTLQQKYDAMEPVQVRMPCGTLLGSRILSQVGPDVRVRILPVAVTRCDFETTFEGQGINQTKYKVYVVLDSSVRVLAPLAAGSIEFTSKMLVCEVVIVGEVPDSYVNVPEEDILDVT